MEDKVTQQEPMPQEEFEEKIKEVAAANKRKMLEDFESGILYLRNYNGVRKYKSIRRAIKRGHVSFFGDLYPKKPYNNRKSHMKSINAKKRRIYGQLVQQRSL